MSKTIKIIDLLNKRANGKKLPQKIKYLDEYYTLYEEAESIENLYLIDGTRVGWLNHANFSLDSTVEIIEEQKEINIQKINEITYKNEKIGYGSIEKYTDDIDDYCTAINSLLDGYGITINELVQAVKQLDNQLKEK